MKRFSKWLLLFSILMFVFVALVACGETQKTTKPTKTNSYKDSEIYQVYLAYAENGGTLSYDEWYASIKGEKGDKGDKGDDGLTPYIGDNGNWWIGEEDTGTKAGSGSGKDVFFTGKCGEKTTWTMYVDGSLSISGTGRVTSTPWDRFSDLIYKTTIKKGIENIPNNAFSQCVNIIEIIISDSVTSIGNSAFSGCSSLTSVTIPDSVTSIGYEAFRGCSSLTSITLGNSVTSIESSAFTNCSRLTSVYYTGDIASWCGITFGNEYSNPLYYAAILYINNELIKDIVIPDTITEIKKYAFYGWNGTSITIPDSVTSIGNSAFNNCSILTSVYYTGDIASWCGITFSGSTSNPLYYAHNLYIDNELIKDIVIPDTVTELKAYAFTGWNGTSITIPDSVTSIGYGVFPGCSSLQSITIPFVGNRAGITSGDTDQYPFGYIFGTSSYTGGTATGQSYYDSSTSSTTYTTYYIPSTLKSVTVTGGYIPYGAFSNCSSLTSITIPTSVTSIGRSAFSGCISLTSITIPDSVTSIEYSAFAGCISLTSITIPDSVTSIGERAFSGCTATIAWGKNPAITTIGTYAFSGYNGPSITIPDSVTSIGRSAFSGCSKLTSITIPDSVTSIGDSAFSGCYHLVEVYNKSSLNIEKGYKDYGYVGYYAKAIYTEEYTSKLSTDSNGYVIYTDGEEKSLIMYTGEETELTLPEGITEINQYAFYNGSSGIASITSIPDSVTSITIPASVTSIGEYAFSWCISLTSITFQGTKAQWNAISKGRDWNSITGRYTVHCTDGDIEK